MKKKKVKKKKISKKKVSSKKFWAIGIIAFFVLGFALNFVNVSQNAIITGEDIKESIVTDDQVSTNPGGGTKGFISNFFTSWEEGDMDVNIAKYLFWIILFFLIYSVLNISNFPENGFFQFLIALPVSFLAIAYLTPEEVFAVLTTYSALGLTLSVVLPFAIMLLFSATLLSSKKMKNMSVSKVMLQVFLWNNNIQRLGI